MNEQKEINKLRNELKKKPAVMFTVPNTPEGRAFIKQMKSYLNNKSYAICQRGRTPTEDSPTTGRPSLPLKYAQNIAVYVKVRVTDSVSETVSPSFYITRAIEQITTAKASGDAGEALALLHDAISRMLVR